MIKQLAHRQLKTKFGIFSEIMFENEVIVLVKGDVKNKRSVPCRIHSSCLSGHAFSSVECECLEEMQNAQKLIDAEGLGVIVWLEQEGRGNGHLAVMLSQKLKNEGMSQAAAYQSLGYKADARTFEPAAEVLQSLEIKSIELLSGSAQKAAELKRFGIVIDRLRPLNR